MQTVTLEEAQAKLPELIRTLLAEQEIVITRDNLSVAKIVPLPAPAISGQCRVPGLLKGQIVFDPGWDEPLEDFAPYQ